MAFTAALTFLLLASTLVAGDFEFCSSDGPFCASLSASSTHLTVSMTSSSGGWVGIGLRSSLTLAMYPADCVVGWIESNGTVVVQDRFCYDHAIPSLDPSSDIEVVSGEVLDGAVTIVFRRPLSTSDAEDIAVTPDDDQLYIWGIGPQPSEGSETFAEHVWTGGFIANIQKGVASSGSKAGGSPPAFVCVALTAALLVSAAFLL